MLIYPLPDKSETKKDAVTIKNNVKLSRNKICHLLPIVKQQGGICPRIWSPGAIWSMKTPKRSEINQCISHYSQARGRSLLSKPGTWVHLELRAHRSLARVSCWGLNWQHNCFELLCHTTFVLFTNYTMWYELCQSGQTDVWHLYEGNILK